MWEWRVPSLRSSWKVALGPMALEPTLGRRPRPERKRCRSNRASASLSVRTRTEGTQALAKYFVYK